LIAFCKAASEDASRKRRTTRRWRTLQLIVTLGLSMDDLADIADVIPADEPKS